MTMFIFALEEIGRNARSLANYASVAGWIIKMSSYIDWNYTQT